MPTAKTTLRIALLLNEHSSVALAFLLKEVFGRANRVSAQDRYAVELVTASGAKALAVSGATIDTRKMRGRYDYLIVPPLESVGADYAPPAIDTRLVRSRHGQGTVVASACLGALTLASAGVLDGREATTHWAWMSVVRSHYPLVDWAPGRMICGHRDVITAGGYLAVVDLALHIIATTSSREIAHRLGQTLLADSIRQKQSVYARQLIDPNVEHRGLRELAGWVERNLQQALPASAMAKRCGMSLRSFHRKFFAAYGTTPRKFLQLKRIEKVQNLLRNTSRSVEQILQTVGVSDVASFRRVFQRELGCSPAEFRRKLRVLA